MEIVSNTSPLVTLSAIGELRLLRELAARVYIPSAVAYEIVDRGTGWQEARQVQEAIAEKQWLLVEAVEETPLLTLLRRQLDPGESEAIVLAQRRVIPILLDDSDARKAAATLGLEFFGSLAVLKLSKRRGLIRSAKPLVVAMREAGTYFSDNLIEEFLNDIGEK